VVGRNRLRNLVRAETCARRGGDQVLRASELQAEDGAGGALEQQADPVPPPDHLVAAAEEYERLLGLLDEELCQIALWKVEGYRNREIASRLGCVETTVERKLQRMRDVLEGGTRP
jgi:DNA-directed RNA polymerase specialized sigma24 family protein